MDNNKKSEFENILQKIEKNICYTKLVYERINKKLKTNYSKEEIEHLICYIITNNTKIIRKGKNYYVFDYNQGIRVTINASNFRVITADNLLNT